MASAVPLIFRRRTRLKICEAIVHAEMAIMMAITRPRFLSGT
jgi:hypothetical protein